MSAARPAAEPRCGAPLLHQATPSPRQAGAAWPRLLALGATLAAALVLAIAAPRLVGVERLAETTRAEVIPRIVVQHKRAIWAESLRSAVDLVVHAPDPAVRKDALIRAEQLASTLLRGADGERRAVLARVIGAIRTAAAAADSADRRDREGRVARAAAGGTFEEFRAALTSSGEDPAGTLLRRPGDTTEPAPDARRQRLGGTLALGATGQDLLGHLDEGRALLTAAASIGEPERLRAAAERFRTIGQQLQSGVSALPHGPNEAHLADMLEGFIALEAVFEHRQTALAANNQVLAAGREARLQLAQLRETPTADAAGAAETNIATIADRVRGIRNVALVTLGAGVAAAVGLTLYGQGATPGLQGRTGEEAVQPQESSRQGHLARSGELTRRYHQAQRNLDYWRDSLPAKLQRTIAAVLTGSPPDHEEREVDTPFAAVSEVHAPALDDAPSLPDPVPELIDGIRDQLFAFTGSTANFGMAAVGDCIVAASAEHAGLRSGEDDEQNAALLRLEAVTETADQAVIQIGLCIAAIDALAGPSPGSPAKDAEPVAHRLQRLFEELVIAREHLETWGRAPG